MKRCVDDVRVAYPLFQKEGGGSTPTSTLSASRLYFYDCRKGFAVDFVRAYHSRLPKCQSGPWQFAFAAEWHEITFAVALWNNPSTRSLPSHWLELRRLCCTPDAPRNTCSRFLMWMVRWFQKRHPERERCISYQDTAVHTGTIYKASGWHIAHRGQDRIRDRSKARVGTSRMYRTNINGIDADAVAKIRWEKPLRKES